MLKAINLGVAFLLELWMLFILGTWGFQASSETAIKVLLGIGTPLVAVVIWGIFLAPRSARRLTGLAYLILKFIIYGIATIAFIAAGQTTLAIIFIVVAIVNQALVMLWKQDTAQTATSNSGH